MTQNSEKFKSDTVKITSIHALITVADGAVRRGHEGLWMIRNRVRKYAKNMYVGNILFCGQSDIPVSYFKMT